MPDFHLVPNWSESVSETYEFRTTIFTSHSGREQRVAERLTPRRTVNFTTLLWDDRLFAFKAMLHARGADTISIPDPARYAAVLLLDAPIGATSIIVTTASWMTENTPIAISILDGSEFLTGETMTPVGAFSIDFDPEDFATVGQSVQITVAAPLTQAWAAGSVVRPVITGRLGRSVTLNHENDRVATASISLSIAPPSTAPVMGSAALGTFNSRSVLLAQPNWAQPPTVTLSTPFEDVDYDRGVIATFLPIEFYTKITQFTYADRSRLDIGAVMSLFSAMRGRQGEFYCPSWTTDMVPSGGIASGSVYLTVIGSGTAATYANSTVETAVAIKLANGSWIFRTVIGIVETNDAGPGAFSTDFDESYDAGGSGAFSRLQFDTAIGFDMAQRDIAMICWLNVCRFASDSLTVRWMTDDVGQAVVQIMSLESLTPEA